MKKTFKDITQNIDMVLFNNSIYVADDLELEAWSDLYLYSDEYSKEEFEKQKEDWEIWDDIDYYDAFDEFKEIYQFFAIAKSHWEYIAKITWMPLYYSEKFDLFILWVDFLDNWANVYYEV